MEDLTNCQPLGKADTEQMQSLIHTRQSRDVVRCQSVRDAALVTGQGGPLALPMAPSSVQSQTGYRALCELGML